MPIPVPAPLSLVDQMREVQRRAAIAADPESLWIASLLEQSLREMKSPSTPAVAKRSSALDDLEGLSTR